MTDAQQTPREVPAGVAELLVIQIIDLGAALQGSLERSPTTVGLGLPALRVLDYCADHGGVTATQIAAGLGMEPPRVSRIVHELAQRRLLTRRRSRTDRRTVTLRASPTGRKRVRRIRQDFAEAERELLQTLPATQARSLRRSVERLRDACS